MRCPECRTRRKSKTLLLRHIRLSGHKTCNCGGYHFPHRIGSGCCDHNPDRRLHLARRAGHVPEVCPF